MHKTKIKHIEWVLRVAIGLTFLGHGFLALQGNEKWIPYLETFGFSINWSENVLGWIGVLDIIVAFIILIKPIKVVVYWALIWTLATALIRHISGESIWAFVERGANWGAPLALLLLQNYKTKIS